MTWQTEPPADGTLCVVELLDGRMSVGHIASIENRWFRYSCDRTLLDLCAIRRYLPIFSPSDLTDEQFASLACGDDPLPPIERKPAKSRAAKTVRSKRALAAESAPVCGVCCGSGRILSPESTIPCPACTPSADTGTGQRGGEGAMTIHEVKCWHMYFRHLWDGTKRFEVRKNDRDYKTGDTIINREWGGEHNDYTGRMIEHRIGYVARLNAIGFDGYVAMQLEEEIGRQPPPCKPSESGDAEYVAARLVPAEDRTPVIRADLDSLRRDVEDHCATATDLEELAENVERLNKDHAHNFIKLRDKMHEGFTIYDEHLTEIDQAKRLDALREELAAAQEHWETDVGQLRGTLDGQWPPDALCKRLDAIEKAWPWPAMLDGSVAERHEKRLDALTERVEQLEVHEDAKGAWNKYREDRLAALERAQERTAKGLVTRKEFAGFLHDLLYSFTDEYHSEASKYIEDRWRKMDEESNRALAEESEEGDNECNTV